MIKFLITLSVITFSSVNCVGKYPYNSGTPKRPHIIIILADDLGWNDVSFHGANQIPTPNIDALAYNGIILNSHYVQPLCTPSRAALMTGKYPTSIGMQHLVLFEPEPRGLHLHEKLLPQYFRAAGYKTHAIGKWHLGYYRKEYTPTYRGFDSFFGYWNGFQDYYSHLVESTIERWIGFDMRRNMSPAFDTVGHYSTDLFTNEAIRLIRNHNTNDPMFLYLSHLAVHSGNQYNPFQAPDETVAKFVHIEDPERRVYAAMVSKLDESVGEVMAALREKGMLKNSIVLFMSDNGAPSMGVHSNKGSNYPLRGIKQGPFEGSIRGVAALWSPLIKNNKRVSNQMISIVDWLPTLYSAAGLNPLNLGRIDGINMWPSLVLNQKSPRTELLLNIDYIDKLISIRADDYKYIASDVVNNPNWYGDTGRHKEDPAYNIHEVLMSKTAKTITALITEQQIAELALYRNYSIQQKQTRASILTIPKVLELRYQAEIKCNVNDRDKVYCNPLRRKCLFHIKDDPCEMVDISFREPRIVKYLEELIAKKYKLTVVSPANVAADPRANPIYWNNTWVNWGSYNLPNQIPQRTTVQKYCHQSTNNYATWNPYLCHK